MPEKFDFSSTELFCEETEKFVAEKDQEIKNKEIKENGENLKSLLDIPDIMGTLDDSFVREEVHNKLKKIQEKLTPRGLGIIIFEAWRSVKRQSSYWQRAIERTKRENPDIKDIKKIEEKASFFTAPLEIAPHCSGGAIDLTLYNLETKRKLDMGTDYDYLKKESYSEYPLISEIAKKNRRFLREIMEEEDFVNLPTEWWHFSYGNKEWAAFKNKDYAVYGITQIDNELK